MGNCNRRSLNMHPTALLVVYVALEQQVWHMIGRLRSVAEAADELSAYAAEELSADAEGKGCRQDLGRD